MELSTLSDEQLLALVAAGEQGALESLYDRYARRVFSLAAYILRDDRRAEDVAQEVFVSVWRHAGSFRPEQAKASTWIMSIAHHRAIDELRKVRRAADLLQRGMEEVALSGTPNGYDPATEAHRSLEREAVHKALESLPPDQRRVVSLAYFGGLTHSEMAQLLQEPLGTVKTRLRLAMRKLRHEMGGAGGGEEGT